MTLTDGGTQFEFCSAVAGVRAIEAGSQVLGHFVEWIIDMRGYH